MNIELSLVAFYRGRKAKVTSEQFNLVGTSPTSLCFFVFRMNRFRPLWEWPIGGAVGLFSNFLFIANCFSEPLLHILTTSHAVMELTIARSF